MNARVEADRNVDQADAAILGAFSENERIVKPLFAPPSSGELLPVVEQHLHHLKVFLATPNSISAASALESCRELAEGMVNIDPSAIKPGRIQMLHSIAVATLRQALTIDAVPSNYAYLAHLFSGGTTGGAILDPALVAAVSTYNESLCVNRLKTLASRGGSCDVCAAAFMELADVLRSAPIQTGQVCKERTEQAIVVATLSQGFAKALPEAKEVLSYCSTRLSLVGGFNEHAERVEMILAAGKLGELSKLFPLLARDMVEAKYVIQKQITEHDESYTIDAAFANTRPGRKPRTTADVG